MNRLGTKEIIGILMESAFYFDLNLGERCSLIKHILDLSAHDALASHPRQDCTNFTVQPIPRACS